jgi:hydroxymethylpyrimidine/phosphomethylpyrimidine kinase
MSREHLHPPVVLVLGGLDPTGGAGLQADIEAVVSMGCHPAPVATALTVQTTHGVSRFEAVDALLLIEQARAVFEDLPVHAVKIGMVPDRHLAEAIHSLLTDLPGVPAVLDPVLASGRGDPLAEDDLLPALCELLLPLARVATPNERELRMLARGADTLEAAARAVLDCGTEHVLVTGADSPTREVVNRLFGPRGLEEAFTWERLPHAYHGSGCTLAAATAGLLAQGAEPLAAVHQAQQYTWEALSRGYALGTGQHLPNRLFWAGQEA